MCMQAHYKCDVTIAIDKRKEKLHKGFDVVFFLSIYKPRFKKEMWPGNYAASPYY